MFPSYPFDLYDSHRVQRKFSLKQHPHVTLVRNDYLRPIYNPGRREYHHAQEHDLRLIVMRHGERVDTAFGNDWFEQSFGAPPTFSPLPAASTILPSKLPRRNPQFHYILDPPITKNGQMLAVAKGQQLLNTFGPIDKCYSSPASRCILTADAIMSGMSQFNVPIRIDRYLFEPLSWNTALLGFSDINPFLSRKDWRKANFNIDLHYRSLGKGLSRRDDEKEFIRRTAAMVNLITADRSQNRHFSMHSNGLPRKQTILVVGHSASPITFQGLLQHSALDPNNLWTQAGSVDLLDALVFDRDAVTQRWTISKVPK